MSQIVLKNGAKAWNFGSEKYVKVDVSNVEEYLYKKGETLPYWAQNQFLNAYRPDIDISEELAPNEALYYESLIVILRWMV